MNSLTEQLRNAAQYYNMDGGDLEETVMWAGADEIERLGSLLEIAVEALRHIRDKGKDAWDGYSEEAADCTLERFFGEERKYPGPKVIVDWVAGKARPRLEKDDGPDGEDGPWAEGWEERSGGKDD